MRIFCAFVLIIITSSCGEQKDKPVLKKKSFVETLLEEQKNQPVTSEESCLDITLIDHVEVVFLSSSEINSTIAGTIESIAEEGTVFKKGDLLVQLDNRDAFDKLVSQKESFIVAAKAFSEKNARNSEWTDFVSKLGVYKLLPEFPKTSNPENVDRQLISQYESVNNLEIQMRDHFIIAKDDGIVLSQKVASGDKVKNGSTLLITGKSKQKVFRLPKSFDQNGNSILENEKTGQKYTVAIDRKNTWIKVKANVPIGKYTLNTHVDN